MSRRLRLLVTGVGSLVGQNILDALESRRDLVEVIGTNAAADTPRIFRCDRAHLVPRNDQPDYQARLVDLIRTEAPDLVLPGRDPDVRALALIARDHPELAARIAVGSPAMAECFEDKFLTYEFARTRGLAFADTFRTGPEANAELLGGFVTRHGFPFIAKPRRGSGSLGVRVVTSEAQLARASQLPGYVLQPFLGPGAENFMAPVDSSAGYPLFQAPPDPGQYACQCVIGRDGRLSEMFCTLHLMIMGRCEEMMCVEEPALRTGAVRFAQAMAEAGWRGSFNLQCRKVGPGQFVGFEINGRMTGGTSGRLHLGFDEVGEIVRAWLGESTLPCLSLPVAANGRVMKSLMDQYLSADEVARLTAEDTWSNLPVFAVGWNRAQAGLATKTQRHEAAASGPSDQPI